jgi:signal peptidase I
MDLRPAISFLSRTAVTSLVVSSFAVLLFVGLLPRTGVYRTLTVLSGSMEPAFRPGDVVVARPTPKDELKVGDVLVYSIPIGDHHVESHRVTKIVSREPLAVITKGDANETDDPWTAELDGDTVWTVRRAVPYVGQAILWLRSPRLQRLTTVFVPGLAVVLILSAVWRRRPDDPFPDANVHRS